ncbi:hypothetical protein SprV_0802494500 [Sparganum proliferum]
MSLIPEDPNSVKDDGPFLEATPGLTATTTVQPSGSTKGEGPTATTVVAAERPDPPKSNSDIPQYYGKEAFATWLRRTRFYLEDVPRAERPRMLLKALAPTQLDKALDAGLHAGLPFENLCQQLANIYGQTGSVGDAIEQLHSRRLKANETPSQLAEELDRLASVAFPTLAAADRETVVLHYFIKALPSTDLSRSLLLQPPGDIHDAIKRAERYLHLKETESQGSTVTQRPETSRWNRIEPTANKNDYVPTRQYPGRGRYYYNQRAFGRALQRRPQPPSILSDAAIVRLPQVETTTDLDLPPSLHKTIEVVQQLFGGKAPRSDPNS